MASLLKTGIIVLAVIAGGKRCLAVDGEGDIQRSGEKGVEQASDSAPGPSSVKNDFQKFWQKHKKTWRKRTTDTTFDECSGYRLDHINASGVMLLSSALNQHGKLQISDPFFWEYGQRNSIYSVRNYGRFIKYLVFTSVDETCVVSKDYPWHINNERGKEVYDKYDEQKKKECKGDSVDDLFDEAKQECDCLLIGDDTYFAQGNVYYDLLVSDETIGTTPSDCESTYETKIKEKAQERRENYLLYTDKCAQSQGSEGAATASLQ
uniref:Putative group i salivary lipocalin n=1 Tax=Rhipicephalus pulchellus TaxID=72859 RepID=L7MBK4_RHIPC